MRKIALTILSLAFFSIPTLTFALPLDTIVATASPDMYSSSYPVSSSDYNYSDSEVVFDDEGEAAVAYSLQVGRVDADTNQVTLTIPGESVRIRRAFQEYTAIVNKERCEQYGAYDSALRDYPCLTTTVYEAEEYKVEQIEATTSLLDNATQVKLVLPHLVEKGKSLKIALSYKASGYATSKLGVWQFTYPTPEVPYDIDTANVRVDVGQDLVLKGGGAQVAYKDSLAESLATAVPAGFDSGFSEKFSPRFSDPQAFIKTGSALDANEAYEVSGTYANSWLRIYWLHILLIILAGLALVGIVIIGERHAARLER